jgi:dienelactone hydrolase
MEMDGKGKDSCVEMQAVHDGREHLVRIPADGVTMEGVLAIPAEAEGVVLFAHGSGSSRHSPRNNYVARVLQNAGVGTLLFDLLTEKEDRIYETRFDIDLLTRRLIATTRWFTEQPPLQELAVGYFGSSTGAASALRAGFFKFSYFFPS